MGSDGKSFPTVLVLDVDADRRARIAVSLRRDGYNVLEADGLPEALQAAKAHSRPIQLLVSGLRCDDAFIDRMQQFRPSMELMVFTREEMFDEPNVVEKIREFFGPAEATGQSKTPAEKRKADLTNRQLRSQAAG